MFNSTTTRIPVSNTVTALEVWLLACMLLVFLSLVEYAVILRQIVIYKRSVLTGAPQCIERIGGSGLWTYFFCLFFT